MARWTWKSGQLKAGSTVPWEIQVLNTLPDNFLWEKDKPSILTVAAGLYQVFLTFSLIFRFPLAFTPKKNQ